MNDRELLELAAKAAGMAPPYDENDVFTAWVINRGHGHWWDPINDDGDALRLAICLDIHISLYGKETGITTWVLSDEEPRAKYFDETYGENPYAATRRAIVRAAAEIGRNMK